MKILQAPSPNYWPGGNRVKVIVIHWWGAPATNPTLSGVIKHLCNPASQVSAHYVVSGDNVMQLIQESDRAWHAQAANHFSIGIEVDPNTPGNTYATVADLVRDIRTRNGNIPLKRHSDYVATACPGGIDLGKIEQLANGGGNQNMYQEEKVNDGDDKNLAKNLALRFDGSPLNWAKGGGWKKAFYDITASEEYRRNIASIQRAMELVGAKNVAEMDKRTEAALTNVAPKLAKARELAKRMNELTKEIEEL